MMVEATEYVPGRPGIFGNRPSFPTTTLRKSSCYYENLYKHLCNNYVGAHYERAVKITYIGARNSLQKADFENPISNTSP